MATASVRGLIAQTDGRDDQWQERKEKMVLTRSYPLIVSASEHRPLGLEQLLETLRDQLGGQAVPLAVPVTSAEFGVRKSMQVNVAVLCELLERFRQT